MDYLNQWAALETEHSSCYGGGKLEFMLSPKLERIELRERFDSEYLLALLLHLRHAYIAGCITSLNRI
jgi:hypothetical protein